MTGLHNLLLSVTVVSIYKCNRLIANKEIDRCYSHGNYCMMDMSSFVLSLYANIFK